MKEPDRGVRERGDPTAVHGGSAFVFASLLVALAACGGGSPDADAARAEAEPVAVGPAGSPAVVEYAIPRANAFPHDPAVGADGMVWYTDQRNSFIGRLDPETGAFQDWPTPTRASGPHGITVAPDGGVWYTGNAAGNLGRLDPATGEIREFPTRGARDPHTLIVHRGAVWFTVQQGNAVGRLDPASGDVEVWPVEPDGARPYGIVPAPDGTLWVALFGTNRLLRIHPDPQPAFESVELPDPASRPRRLVVDADGVVWYTDYPRGKIGRYDPGDGSFDELDTPTPDGQPYGIAIGSDGRLWYDEASSGLMVALDPVTREQETARIPTPNAIVRHMATDSTRGRVWLALSGTGRIGRIDAPARP
jgi:virginiamycin B lyase